MKNGLLTALFLLLVSAPIKAQTLQFYSSEYFQFLCSQVSSTDQAECLQLGRSIMEQSFAQSKVNITAKDIRPLILAFTRNQEFRAVIERHFFRNNTSENTVVRKKIWDQFNVLILDGGWSTAELLLLERGYKKLSLAIQQAVGSERHLEFSHIWGAGGIVARKGGASIKGQFGEVYSNFPFQINVVVNIVQNNFGDLQVAQRIAHENAHSQDVIMGAYKTGQPLRWSETSEAKIFSACRVKVDYESSLMSCRQKHLSWFNFHSTNYAAYNSAEFYGKMMDEWVREKLSLVQAGRYRCQNSFTKQFWNDFEQNLIGEIISPPCQ